MTDAPIRFAMRCVAVACLCAAGISTSSAQVVDKYWKVAGTDLEDTLAVRALPFATSKVVARVPATAEGLPRGICATINHQSGNTSEWCRVAVDGAEGWAERRFLVPDTASRLPIYAPPMQPNQVRYQSFAADHHKWKAPVDHDGMLVQPCSPLMHGDELVLICKIADDTR